MGSSPCALVLLKKAAPISDAAGRRIVNKVILLEKWIEQQGVTGSVRARHLVLY